MEDGFIGWGQFGKVWGLVGGSLLSFRTCKIKENILRLLSLYYAITLEINMMHRICVSGVVRFYFGFF